MTKTEIKRNIHNLIDTFENEDTLAHINEMLESISEESVSFGSLSADEKRSINKGIEELDGGKKIDYDDIKKKFPEWLRK